KSMDRSDLWVFPIAIPLLIGPGTITTTIVLMGSAASVMHGTLVIVSILLNYSVAWLMFHYSRKFYKLLGYTGMLVITRLMGLLLAAIAVNFVAIGVWNIYQSFM
ncbi:MAG: MarC family protein, partial [Methanolobus sp.]|nr:MarC family protein [Methanolobus sp.]